MAGTKGKAGGPPALHAALLAATGTALAAWTWGAWPDVMVDFGRELYVPWRIVEGDVLYRDVAWLHGPLSPHWNALWFAALGVGLRTLVIVNLGLLVLATGLLHRLLARVAGRVAATVACVVFLVAFAFPQLLRTGNYNWVCPYSHEATHGVILCLGTLAALDHWAGRRHAAWVALAGACLGLAFLTQAPVFVAGAAAGAGLLGLWLVGEPAARTRAARLVAVFAAASAAPSVASVALLSRAMPAGDALRATLGAWPAILGGEVSTLPFYERLAGFDDPAARLAAMFAWGAAWGGVLLGLAGLARLARRAGRSGPLAVAGAFVLGAAALAGVHLEAWLGILAPLPLVVLGIAAGRARALASGDEDAHAARTGLALAAFAFLLLGRMWLNARAYHYGFTLAAPATLLAVAMLVGRAPAWLGRRGADGRVFRAAALGALATACVAHLQATHHYLVKKTAQVGSGADAFRAGRRGEVVNEALAILAGRPAGTLAVLPEGVMLNYLSRRPAPTRHLNYMPPELAIFGGEAAIVAALDASPPDLVVVAHKDLAEYGFRYFGDDYAQRLHRWLHDRYEPFASVARPPLTPGRRFGLALMEPRAEPAGGPPAQSAGPGGSTSSGPATGPDGSR